MAVNVVNLLLLTWCLAVSPAAVYVLPFEPTVKGDVQMFMFSCDKAAIEALQANNTWGKSKPIGGWPSPGYCGALSMCESPGWALCCIDLPLPIAANELVSMITAAVRDVLLLHNRAEIVVQATCTW